jgi:hypothetical protein
LKVKFFIAGDSEGMTDWEMSNIPREGELVAKNGLTHPVVKVRYIHPDIVEVFLGKSIPFDIESLPEV